MLGFTGFGKKIAKRSERPVTGLSQQMPHDFCFLTTHRFIFMVELLAVLKHLVLCVFELY